MSLETKLIIGFIGMAIDMTWYVLVAVFGLDTALGLVALKRFCGEQVTALVLWGFASTVMFGIISG